MGAGGEPVLLHDQDRSRCRWPTDLLARLGRTEEARHEFERAAALTVNKRERTLLLRRAAEC